MVLEGGFCRKGSGILRRAGSPIPAQVQGGQVQTLCPEMAVTVAWATQKLSSP